MMFHQHPCDCGICHVPRFERNNYFNGKTLSARDLAAEQVYLNEKRHLINRSILGWGIVCGLNVCLEGDCLEVHPGLALDCCGRELLVCDKAMLHPRDVADALGVDPCAGGDGIPWALCLEYRECRTEPVSLPKSCDQHERGREFNRIRDDYRLSIRRRDDACPEDHDEACCPWETLGRGTSLHEALVERSRKCPKCKKCECVLLVTGVLHTGPQGPWITLDEDAWKYRRIVFTNPALASLIQCFHGGLTHITSMNWQPDEKYTVDRFLDLLTKERLRVTFDRPMKVRSVTNERTCRLTIYLPDGDGCPKPTLIPVERIDYTDPTAIYYFDEDCVHQHLRRSCKSIRKPVDVELILHGSMMQDQKGRALDAEFIDSAFPTGNGVQGGEFIAYFTVAP
jgi:hypothetical protein